VPDLVPGPQVAQPINARRLIVIGGVLIDILSSEEEDRVEMIGIEDRVKVAGQSDPGISRRRRRRRRVGRLGGEKF